MNFKQGEEIPMKKTLSLLTVIFTLFSSGHVFADESVVVGEATQIVLKSLIGKRVNVGGGGFTIGGRLVGCNFNSGFCLLEQVHGVAISKGVNILVYYSNIFEFVFVDKDAPRTIY